MSNFFIPSGGETVEGVNHCGVYAALTISEGGAGSSSTGTLLATFDGVDEQRFGYVCQKDPGTVSCRDAGVNCNFIGKKEREGFENLICEPGLELQYSETLGSDNSEEHCSNICCENVPDFSATRALVLGEDE